MNDILTKLADECRTLYRDGHGQYIEQFDEEKFAEFIVRECMSIADLPKNLSGQWDHLESSEVIAKHFGVE